MPKNLFLQATKGALCVIFTISVSFSRDNVLFASKAKIIVFWNFFEWSGPEGASGVKKKFQKTLILVVEVIVQPPKTHVLTFSKVQKHNMEKKVRPKSWKSHIVKGVCVLFWVCYIIYFKIVWKRNHTQKTFFSVEHLKNGGFLREEGRGSLWWVGSLVVFCIMISCTLMSLHES